MGFTSTRLYTDDRILVCSSLRKIRVIAYAIGVKDRYIRRFWGWHSISVERGFYQGMKRDHSEIFGVENMVLLSDADMWRLEFTLYMSVCQSRKNLKPVLYPAMDGGKSDPYFKSEEAYGGRFHCTWGEVRQEAFSIGYEPGAAINKLPFKRVLESVSNSPIEHKEAA